MLERVQKILSARGIASRRKAEEYIEQGLVTVNGKVITLGDKADPLMDVIEVDGKVLSDRQEMLYYLMNKSKGVVTTSRLTDEEKLAALANPKPTGTKGGFSTGHNVKVDPSVADVLPLNLRGKINPVGRLDKDSEGLLLFTNDGVLAFRLTHPKFDHEKEYEVYTMPEITDGQLHKLREGVKLFGTPTKPATITRVGPNIFRIALTEGRNRQIRRMVQKVGCEVVRLVRVRIVTLTDKTLRTGSIRKLTPDEVKTLLQKVGM